MSEFRTLLHKYMTTLTKDISISLDPSQAASVGWLSNWTCWCAHNPIELCTCLRIVVSALCKQGAAQGHAAAHAA